MVQGLFRTLLVWAVLAAGPAQAHEVWFEMSDWTLDPGAGFTARLINGDNFEGVELPWNPRAIQRAEMWQGEDGFRLVGRAGDRPAISINAGQAGLLALVYQPGYNTVVYDTLEKFAAFAEEKGQGTALADHAARGLPQEKIREAYIRHVKVLAAVGHGRGADRARGMELEIVALDNPYTTDPSEPLRFQVLYRDAPLSGNQVMLLARDAAGAVTKELQQTGADGSVSFRAAPGFTYLVDSVILRAPDADLAAEANDAVWESLWASLTFARPAEAQ